MGSRSEGELAPRRSEFKECLQNKQANQGSIASECQVPRRICRAGPVATFVKVVNQQHCTRA
jgi:hypothetical protein